ncbi:MAG: orotidine-5'-phosphate decarboxylase [Candidatus Omnitrophota bacterium]
MNPTTENRQLKTKLTLALDVDSLKKAKYFVNRLYPKIKIFKVGLQLFTIAGPDIIKFIQKKGGQVFLDLKFFDIPNTVRNAVRQAVRLKVKMVTLHIQGEDEMLRAAVKAAKEESRRLNHRRPLLIGVTVLTSQKASSGRVLKLAKLALRCGLDGVVCSAKEARALRKNIKRNFLIFTPGIRPKGALSHDQERVASAGEAIEAGSDFLIIGRPILEAKDPVLALKQIIS